jgi:hypothetical protein
MQLPAFAGSRCLRSQQLPRLLDIDQRVAIEVRGNYVCPLIQYLMQRCVAVDV